VTGVLLAIGRFALSTNAALNANGLGICSGRRATAHAKPALTEWLDEQIQICASPPNGSRLAPPLTFRMLEGLDPPVSFRLLTTDLSYARPVDLPLSDDPPSTEPRLHGLTTSGKVIYYFDKKEFDRLFPEPIVAALIGQQQPAILQNAPPGKTFYRLPGADMPILVAARMSLSFPILLSTVPLWSEDPSLPAPVQHTMSDGGICANFPIHFFDALFPSRPTFGLDLEPFPGSTDQLTEQPPIIFDDLPRRPTYAAVAGVGAFFAQLLGSARNWHDNLQSELPAYRDRICQIRLTKDQGGLNLDMPPEVIKQLVQLGEDAGNAICPPPRSKLPGFNWNQHRFTRFLTLMQTLQEGLEPAGPAFNNFVAQMPTVDPAWPTYPGHSGNWWPTAATTTQNFLASVTWGSPGTTNFKNDAPVPEADVRVSPQV
jgi:hypothetical protein